MGAALLLVPALRRRDWLLAWAGLTLLLCLAPPTLRLLRGGEVREYTFAHYYLGAKYFEELGYDGIYAQSSAARPRAEIDAMRDLRTYELIAAPGTRGDWTEPRWSAFGGDLDVLASRQDTRSWRSWYRDKGYNATPAWTATFGRLLSARPASPAWFALMGWLDLALLLCPLLVAVRVFGWPAALAGAGVAVFSGSAQNLVAGPLQLDWFAAVVLAVCAFHRGRDGLGGALLGWAVVSRVFPVLLLAGPLLAAWRRPSLRPRVARLVLGASLIGAVGLGLGASTVRGPGAWAEFASKIETHSQQHHVGDRRIGLRPLLAWAPVGERTDRDARDDRAARWPGRRVGAAVVALTLALLWGAAMRRGARRSDEIAVLLLISLSLPFVLLTLSRYYQLLPVLGLLWVARHQAAAHYGAALLGVFGLSWCAIAALPDATAYAVGNGLWLVLFAGASWRFALRPR